MVKIISHNMVRMDLTINTNPYFKLYLDMQSEIIPQSPHVLPMILLKRHGGPEEPRLP